MRIKQFYRYVFGQWDNLSADEVTSIPELFSSYLDNQALRNTITALKANELYKRLYDVRGPRAYYYDDISVDRNTETWLSMLDARYYYFEASNKEAVLKAYQAFFSLFRLLGKMNKASVCEAHTQAYQLLVLFGGEENIEEALDKFDSYLETKGITKLTDIHTALDFELRKNDKQKSINLPTWRKIIQEVGLDKSRRLFYIAVEIEEVLGHPPENFDEAMRAAASIDYANSANFPEFAQFCVEQYIPEEIYDQCTGSDVQARSRARRTILSLIPDELSPEFIAMLPSITDFEELRDLLDVIKPPSEATFLNVFGQSLANKVTKEEEFSNVLRKLFSRESQQRFIDILTPGKVNSFFQSYYWEFILRAVHPDYRETFIRDVIGMESLNTRVNDSFSYERFLKLALPAKNQVPYLKTILGIEKIRAFLSSHCHVVNHLELIRPEERFEYLTDIIGAKKLRELLCSNWYMLEAVLKVLNPADYFRVMFEVVGIAELSKIIPNGPDRRAVVGICALFPEDQRPLFLDKLLSDEEKLAKTYVLGLKEKIIKTNFSLGIMSVGWSGKEITLDDGSKKTVPSTVKKHWDEIKKSESYYVSYEEAWKNVVDLSIKAQQKGSLTLLARANETTNYLAGIKAIGYVKKEQESSECRADFF